MGVRRGGGETGISPLEFGPKNQNVLEKVKSAAQFRLIGLILAMTVYLPVRHSHCTRTRFAVLVSCSSELAVSGIASPRILGGPKCLILGEKHYFVWKNAYQSTKWLYVLKTFGGTWPLCPPWIRLCLQFTYVCSIAWPNLERILLLWVFIA